MQFHFHSRDMRESVAECKVLDRDEGKGLIIRTRKGSIIRIELKREGFRIVEDCYVLALCGGEEVSLSAGAYVNVTQDDEFIGCGRFYECGNDIHIEEVREEVT